MNLSQSFKGYLIEYPRDNIYIVQSLYFTVLHKLGLMQYSQKNVSDKY